MAPVHLGAGSHEESMRLPPGETIKRHTRYDLPLHLRAQAIVIDVEQCNCSSNLNPTLSPDSYLRCDESRCGVDSFGSLFSRSEREIGATLYNIQ